jgi:hypothetical protein
MGTQTVMIQVKFKEHTEFGDYCDALYLTEEQYAKMEQKEIDAIKEARVAKWLTVVKNPIVNYKPTKEELQSELDIKLEEVYRLQDRISAKVAEGK